MKVNLKINCKLSMYLKLLEKGLNYYKRFFIVN